MNSIILKKKILLNLSNKLCRVIHIQLNLKPNLDSHTKIQIVSAHIKPAVPDLTLEKKLGSKASRT
jgi:hypothetical protein